MICKLVPMIWLIYIAGDHYMPDRHHFLVTGLGFQCETNQFSGLIDFEAESPILIKAVAKKSWTIASMTPMWLG